ncbi:uncharacterized protein BKA78DRAFT_301603 [Phyllosticta capitalensis]|uniref:uncharacterized protein n=1 Tax=Phyllosticta capitalensis TaxID=121624 RepID=UPI0031327000
MEMDAVVSMSFSRHMHIHPPAPCGGRSSISSLPVSHQLNPQAPKPALSYSNREVPFLPADIKPCTLPTLAIHLRRRSGVPCLPIHPHSSTLTARIYACSRGSLSTGLVGLSGGAGGVLGYVRLGRKDDFASVVCVCLSLRGLDGIYCLVFRPLTSC